MANWNKVKQSMGKAERDREDHNTALDAKAFKHAGRLVIDNEIGVIDAALPAKEQKEYASLLKLFNDAGDLLKALRPSDWPGVKAALP